MGAMQASPCDIARWKREGRYDILQWMSCGDLWINPVTGSEASRCPFVKERGSKFECTIYETRPKVCREYPLNVSHMKAVDCEMMETGDTDDDVMAYITDVLKRQD